MEIASRILKLRRDGTDVDVPVRVFAPEQLVERAWQCVWEIGFPEGTKRRSASGVVSAQALIQCLWMIGIVL